MLTVEWTLVLFASCVAFPLAGLAATSSCSGRAGDGGFKMNLKDSIIKTIYNMADWTACEEQCLLEYRCLAYTYRKLGSRFIDRQCVLFQKQPAVLIKQAQMYKDPTKGAIKEWRRGKCPLEDRSKEGPARYNACSPDDDGSRARVRLFVKYTGNIKDKSQCQTECQNTERCYGYEFSRPYNQPVACKLYEKNSQDGSSRFSLPWCKKIKCTQEDGEYALGEYEVGSTSYMNVLPLNDCMKKCIRTQQCHYYSYDDHPMLGTLCFLLLGEDKPKESSASEPKSKRGTCS